MTRQGKKTSQVRIGIVPSLTRDESGGLTSRWPREFPILTSFARTTASSGVRELNAVTSGEAFPSFRSG